MTSTVSLIIFVNQHAVLVLILAIVPLMIVQIAADKKTDECYYTGTILVMTEIDIKQCGLLPNINCKLHKM